MQSEQKRRHQGEAEQVHAAEFCQEGKKKETAASPELRTRQRSTKQINGNKEFSSVCFSHTTATRCSLCSALLAAADSVN